jgi:hypothetical protein
MKILFAIPFLFSSYFINFLAITTSSAKKILAPIKTISLARVSRDRKPSFLIVSLSPLFIRSSSTPLSHSLSLWCSINAIAAAPALRWPYEHVCPRRGINQTPSSPHALLSSPLGTASTNRHSPHSTIILHFALHMPSPPPSVSTQHLLLAPNPSTFL